MWIGQLYDAFDKFTDIFNIGRLFFYTVAGIFIFYPMAMIFNLITGIDKIKSFYIDIDVMAPSDFGTIFFGSIVLGFLISIIGYALIIEPVSKLQKNKQQNNTVNIYSFSYRYPHMKNNLKEDYQKWLISEYYRFVEIATYIPLGILAGLFLLVVYTAIYLFIYSSAYPFEGTAYIIVFLFVLSVLTATLYFYVWDKFWKPIIITPIIMAYSNSKKHLIDGIDDYNEQCKKNKEILSIGD